MQEVLEHVERESNQNNVLESPTAKACRIGDSDIADA